MRKSAPLFCALLLSLSVRRAWIEIDEQFEQEVVPEVALRKESVDRNLVVALLAVGRAGALSVRRAWIEISMGRNDKPF